MKYKIGAVSAAVAGTLVISALAADTLPAFPFATGEMSCYGPRLILGITFTPTFWDQERSPRQPPLPYAQVTVRGLPATSTLVVNLDCPTVDGAFIESHRGESSLFRASGEANQLSPMYAVIPARQTCLPATIHLDRFSIGFPLKGTIEMCLPEKPCSTSAFELPWNPPKDGCG